MNFYYSLEKIIQVTTRYHNLSKIHAEKQDVSEIINSHHLNIIKNEIDKYILFEPHFKNEKCIFLPYDFFRELIFLSGFVTKKKFILFVQICKTCLYNFQKRESFIKSLHINKVLNNLNIIYYSAFYYFHLLNNYSRYQKGYYYSVSKRKFISLNADNEKKIMKQYHKFVHIVSELELFLDQFYNNWVHTVMNVYPTMFESIILHFQKKFCIFVQEISLPERVNSDFRFLNFTIKLKNIKKNYFTNVNYFSYRSLLPFEMDEDDLFPIFYYFLNKILPEMTDYQGVPLEDYYVQIPLM